MLYRYETHCHASTCSACAHSTPQELVRSYKSAGYAGLVLTDHFIHGNTSVDPALPWKERMKCYYQAYLDAKTEGDLLDFDVIFGLEHAYGGGQEMLIYGIDLEFLLSNPQLQNAALEEWATLVHDYGGILVQAHPYRYGGWEAPLRPELIDGIEIFNAGNDPLKNRMALQKAREIGCIMTSGADTHAAAEHRVGRAGIALPHRVRDGQGLVSALKSKAHSQIIHGYIISDVTFDDLE